MIMLGYAGGNGGGAIRIVTQNLAINGSLTSDGVIGAGGGAGSGSGGSIWITTTSLSGSGLISAVGGPAASAGCTAGAGAGGRIAVYYDTYTFNGTLTAVGGLNPSGTGYGGGAGTIYMKSTTQINGKLYVRNGNHVQNTVNAPSPSSTTGSVTWITEPGVSDFIFDEVYVIQSGELAFVATGLAIGAQVSIHKLAMRFV